MTYAQFTKKYEWSKELQLQAAAKDHVELTGDR